MAVWECLSRSRYTDATAVQSRSSGSERLNAEEPGKSRGPWVIAIPTLAAVAVAVLAVVSAAREPQLTAGPEAAPLEKQFQFAPILTTPTTVPPAAQNTPARDSSSADPTQTNATPAAAPAASVAQPSTYEPGSQLEQPRSDNPYGKPPAALATDNPY